MKIAKVYIPQTEEELREILGSKQGAYRTGRLIMEEMADFQVLNLVRKFLNTLFWDLDKFELNSLASFLDGMYGENHRITYMDKSKYRNKLIREEPYDYIPLGKTALLEEIQFAKPLFDKLDHIHFVDAGSGEGDKVFLFERIFGMWHKEKAENEIYKSNYHTFTGIELCPEILHYAKNRHRGFDFREGDITAEDYKDYNVIYAYNPINGPVGMEKFFKRVLRTAKIGTICIFFNVGSGWAALNDILETGGAYKKTFKKLSNESKHSTGGDTYTVERSS